MLKHAISQHRGCRFDFQNAISKEGNGKPPREFHFPRKNSEPCLWFLLSSSLLIPAVYFTVWCSSHSFGFRYFFCFLYAIYFPCIVFLSILRLLLNEKPRGSLPILSTLTSPALTLPCRKLNRSTNLGARMAR